MLSRDLKSVVRKDVRVRLPPSAPCLSSLQLPPYSSELFRRQSNAPNDTDDLSEFPSLWATCFAPQDESSPRSGMRGQQPSSVLKEIADQDHVMRQAAAGHCQLFSVV